MNESNRNLSFIRNPFFPIILGLIIAIILSIVSLQYEKLMPTIAVILLSAIIGYLVSFTWEVSSHFRKQDNMDKKIDDLNALKEQLISHQAFEDKHFGELRNKQDVINQILKEQIDYHESLKGSIIPKQFHPFFEMNNNIDRDIVKKILPKYIDSFTYNQELLAVKGEYWALSCYKELWDNLVIRQKTNPDKQIHVKAVDISYEKINQEKRHVIKTLIEKQSDFLKSGGKITRIFIGLDESKNQIRDLFDVLFKIESNEKKSYESYFVKRKDAKDNYFKTNDFLIVKDVCSCQWSYEGEGIKTPNNVKIISGNDDEISEKWNQIYDKAIANKNCLLN